MALLSLKTVPALSGLGWKLIPNHALTDVAITSGPSGL